MPFSFQYLSGARMSDCAPGNDQTVYMTCADAANLWPNMSYIVPNRQSCKQSIYAAWELSLRCFPSALNVASLMQAW